MQKPLGDIDFMQDILSTIEKQNIPAPAPIEQRWTARSHAPMSPAHSNDPNQVFSWVGVIMYLPPGQDDEGMCVLCWCAHGASDDRQDPF